MGDTIFGRFYPVASIVVGIGLAVWFLLAAYIPIDVEVDAAVFFWATVVFVTLAIVGIAGGLARDFVLRSGTSALSQGLRADLGRGGSSGFIDRCQEVFHELRKQRELLERAVFSAAKSAAKEEFLRGLIRYEIPLFVLALVVLAERLFAYVHTNGSRWEDYFLQAWIGWGAIAVATVLLLAWEFYWRWRLEQWVRATLEAHALRELVEPASGAFEPMREESRQEEMLPPSVPGFEHSPSYLEFASGTQVDTKDVAEPLSPPPPKEKVAPEEYPGGLPRDQEPIPEIDL